jgi:GntR family transcriptional regulator/MocR family aminotransferase
MLISNLQAANPRLHVTGAAAGLNVLLPLSSARLEATALAAANAAGIGLGGITADRYYERGRGAGLIVGLAAAPEHAFPSSIEALAGVLVAIDP